jgi:hypothetical protein
VLDNAGAVAVLLRPDRHVLAYLGTRPEDDWSPVFEALGAVYRPAAHAAGLPGLPRTFPSQVPGV